MKRSYCIFLLFLCLIITLTGCGGGSSSSLSNNVSDTSSYCLALIPGSSVTVSQFAHNNYYTINSPVLQTKPQANSSSRSFYSFSIQSTPTASSVDPSHGANLSRFNADSQQNPLSPGQATLDTRLREKENELLQQQLPQLNPQSKKYIASPTPIRLGTKWNNVNIVATSQQIDTTCLYISNRAYIFVDNRDCTALQTLVEDYGKTFDKVYDTNHRYFGTENDVDRNNKVIIIFTRELNSSNHILGYFYAGDKFSKSTVNDSNEGDIIYITADTLYHNNINYGKELVYGVLAHEFQHMIYFDQHYNRGVLNTYTWLNEALSQAAEYYNGYLVNHNIWIQAFLEGEWEGLSLTHWTDNNYGYSAIFIRYLIDQYGDGAIKKMCSTKLVGIAAVENATGRDFNTIFHDFTRALVLSGTGVTSEPRYNFKTLNLREIQPSGRGGLMYKQEYIAGDIISKTLYPYEIFFCRWTENISSLTLTGANQSGTAFGINR